MNKILFSRKSDHWKTPSRMYQHYMKFCFDPCPFHADFDGLKIEWKEYNFVNPPYSKIKEFVNKSIEEHIKGKDVLLLIPARTDTQYFRKLVEYGCDITFITGRLHFNDGNSAPFPSCLIRLTGKVTITFWRDRKDVE